MKLLVILMIPTLGMAGEINVNVKGMVCGFCAQGIEKKLKDEPGVKSVKIDLEKKNVTVETAADADVTNDVLKKLMKDAGFNVDDENIQRTPSLVETKKEKK